MEYPIWNFLKTSICRKYQLFYLYSFSCGISESGNFIWGFLGLSLVTIRVIIGYHSLSFDDMQWLTYLYNSFLTAIKVAFLCANKFWRFSAFSGIFRHFGEIFASTCVNILRLLVNICVWSSWVHTQNPISYSIIDIPLISR